jgi:hypothetical protein
MYQYYNTLHFWGRLAAVREQNGFATEDEHNLRWYLSSQEYPVHEPINLYLQGIGDFEDPSGMEYKFRLQWLPGKDNRNGIAGYFGPVDCDTHQLYESLPAPGVAMQVVADLQYTTGQGQKIWNLPEELRPPFKEWSEKAILPNKRVRGRAIPKRVEPQPTANLLGWLPAVRLTNEQRQILENCGVQEEGFADHLVRFSLNSGLFEAIADRVRTFADRYKCGASLHEHHCGSLAQCPYVERDNQPVMFSRTGLYCEGGMRTGCAYCLDTRMRRASLVMAFRN